jgi:methylated-DNA-[protein]-cysteine S-methyltransferase
MNKQTILIGSKKGTRLGEVWAALSERGLVTVDFGIARARFEAAVRKQTRSEVEYAPARLSEVTRQIKEYLDGKRRAFDLRIDWSALSSDFQRAALRAVFSIPYGETRTYAAIAAQIGHPNAPRAVGRANATNPMPLVIPCHRVIGTDGKLHGYGGAGGLKTKAWLLKMEKDG